MSGGHFDYKQYALHDIADQIQNVIDNNHSVEKNEWGENKGRNYPPYVIESFELCVKLLRFAGVFTHRIDYLLSGDDSEESFMEGLQEDLEKMQ